MSDTRDDIQRCIDEINDIIIILEDIEPRMPGIRDRAEIVTLRKELRIARAQLAQMSLRGERP